MIYLNINQMKSCCFKRKSNVTAIGYLFGSTTTGITLVMNNDNKIIDDNGDETIKSEEITMEEV